MYPKKSFFFTISLWLLSIVFARFRRFAFILGLYHFFYCCIYFWTLRLLGGHVVHKTDQKLFLSAHQLSYTITAHDIKESLIQGAGLHKGRKVKAGPLRKKESFLKLFFSKFRWPLSSRGGGLSGLATSR